LANNTRQTLLDTFQAVNPGQERQVSDILDSGVRMTSAVEQAARHISAIGTSSSQPTGGSGNAVLSAVSRVFTSGLGLMPLVSGLLGLFGGGGRPEPPPLEKYTWPESISFQGATTGTGISEADYDQTGVARLYDGRRAGLNTPTTAAAASPPPAANPANAPQIHVNVQAMDARSFLDHSTEIAQAVRQAMLNLNSINDVVNDL
jgi:hypothetical protein